VISTIAMIAWGRRSGSRNATRGRRASRVRRHFTTEFGVNGFTEALRQEVTKKHVRVAEQRLADKALPWSAISPP